MDKYLPETIKGEMQVEDTHGVKHLYQVQNQAKLFHSVWTHDSSDFGGKGRENKWFSGILQMMLLDLGSS